MSLDDHREEPTAKRTMNFEPVELKAAAPGWCVRVMLAHGEYIQMDEFKTETGARNRIVGKSAARLKKYRGGRYAERSFSV